MKDIALELPDDAYYQLWYHLLPPEQQNEQAAFAFVRPRAANDSSNFSLVKWYPIPPEGFEYQSGFHLELADAERARVIKTAHDLNSSIVEFHSHLSARKPAFSGSDLIGFDETVPHFMWRLKGKPYFAVVVSRSGFDGLAWISNPQTPTQLNSIRAGRKTLYASCRTLNSYE